ncbi:hypothetical protein IEQ34_024032 [Dendrobium chrysotoxum]|uniref:Cytochrome c biogenesis ccmF n=1 Tax=Dendrobium chrysotoxum TaxID=161865 RepID=A0AAV7FTH7_DENCH|nr:hypothetical protein IEQ34_024032 [Dendrobium chrysotoxum]
MSINSFSHYSLFPGLFVAFTYHKKQPPAFGAAPAFLTWTNHEGSIFSWCWIPSFMDSFFVTGVDPKAIMSQNEEAIEKLFLAPLSRTSLGIPFYLSNKKVGPSCTLPSEPLWILKLRSRRNRTFDGPALFYAPLDPKMSFALLGAGLSRGSREGKRTNLLLHLARDEKERASSIDEQRIDGALGIALFFSPFLSASSDPFVRNFFVRTEPLAESNPVPQDQLSAIHPPRIYAGAVASAMGFGLCRSKMMNRIVALHSPPMLQDAAEKNGTLLRSAGCVGSHHIEARS